MSVYLKFNNMSMRTIRFRGLTTRSWAGYKKVPEYNVWLYGVPMICEEEVFIINSLDDFTYCDLPGYGKELSHEKVVFAETVGQYTGIKQKNGKEIYEGDIVCTDDGYSTIVYRNGSFMLNEEDRHLDFYADGGAEVIGNIHEKEKLGSAVRKELQL